MKAKFLGLILGASLVSGVALAQDESAMVVPTSQASTFRYGYSAESYEKADGSTVEESWYSARSGHLSGAIDSKLNKYRLRLNANAGDLVGLPDNAALKKFQVELGGESNRAPYGLLATELALVKHVNLFVGTVHNPGGSQRFVVGPIMYWSQSHSMLLYYPKPSKSESVVEHSLILKNRVREFGKLAWLDADASYKVVPSDDQVAGFSDYGYGLTLGVWKLYGKYSVTPYWEGNKVQKTAYEAGIDASF